MHGLESQPEKQLGISPVCSPAGVPLTPSSSEVTGLYLSGQGRSQQMRADAAAVLWGWLEAGGEKSG